MRKIIVFVVGIIFALIAFFIARQSIFKEGRDTGLSIGKEMCQDILNRCDFYCQEAVKKGVYK